MEAASAQPQERVGFFRVLWRAIRQVFHETVGAVFLLMACSWTLAALRLWRRGSAEWLLGACIGFVFLMVFFGVTSFRAARRVR